MVSHWAVVTKTGTQAVEKTNGIYTIVQSKAPSSQRSSPLRAFVPQQVRPTDDWQQCREPADDANLGWGHGEWCSGLIVRLVLRQPVIRNEVWWAVGDGRLRAGFGGSQSSEGISDQGWTHRWM